MNLLITIIKSDYLQRTRSYAFLITLCASLAIAYTFVPATDAGYSTIRISDYVGVYNSVWFGYVTAIMTSIFLSLIGFYLVNSGIKTDYDTKVGQIIATTNIKNFTYLIAKALSNFLVLLTIFLMVGIMSVTLFFVYNAGYPFEPLQFIKPYALITIPALFVISIVAVLFEVFLLKYSTLQNIGYFFLFSILMVYNPKTESDYSLDVFGSKIIMHQLEERVREITNSEEEMAMNIGFSIGNHHETKTFEFTGIEFPTSFIVSRLLWMALGIVLLFLSAPLFHRFNLKEKPFKKNKAVINLQSNSVKTIRISRLPSPLVNFSVFPLIKAECLLLFRNSKKWLWIVTIIGVVLLAVLPIKVTHQIVLPVLWFLQVSRLSSLTTKESMYNVHYFGFTSYKPLSRLLTSQIFAGYLLMLVLALPLLIRLIIISDYVSVGAVILGALFIVLLAATLGILTRAKKLFEVLFFMITYANINGLSIVDYYGGFEHHSFYLIQLIAFIILLGSISILMRKSQLEK
ncbi:hypothetical protein [Dokdonia sp.]|uniref:hypothetical protein n=1 Tax=Dokdonia sp. TaxID=2024995 RepID=UPI003266A6C4